jgi:hypothetical protein
MNATSIALLVSAAPLVLGCGAPDEAAVPGLPAELEAPGVYTVPAAPGATFAISSVRVEQGGGTVSVYYDLPADLVGRKERVALDGAADGAGSILLWGAAGMSMCTVSPTELRCEEHLVGVHIDAAQASAGLPPGDPRRAAAEAFSVDPIGVLGVDLSGRVISPGDVGSL